MRWRLRLTGFDFDVAYLKGYKQTQRDELFHLPSNGHTTEHADLEISCLGIDAAISSESLWPNINFPYESDAEIELQLFKKRFPKPQ